VFCWGGKKKTPKKKKKKKNHTKKKKQNNTHLIGGGNTARGEQPVKEAIDEAEAENDSIFWSTTSGEVQRLKCAELVGTTYRSQC